MELPWAKATALLAPVVWGSGPAVGQIFFENLHGQSPMVGLPDLVAPDSTGGVLVLLNVWQNDHAYPAWPEDLSMKNIALSGILCSCAWPLLQSHATIVFARRDYPRQLLVAISVLTATVSRT